MKFIFLILGFCLFFLLGCNLINEPTAIPPSAQIANIYDITDTSAQVDVQVTKQSNAEWGGLILNVFSISKILIQQVNLPNDPLPTSFSCKVSKLSSQTEYNLQMFFTGAFDIGGGPEQDETFNIGSPKSFTTN